MPDTEAEPTPAVARADVVDAAVGLPFDNDGNKNESVENEDEVEGAGVGADDDEDDDCACGSGDCCAFLRATACTLSCLRFAR